jgi:hypothetical protein
MSTSPFEPSNPTPADEPRVRLATPEETQAVATQSLDTATLQFPSSGYIGVAADFADLYGARYESAEEFFYFDFLALIGAMVSGRVRADFGVPCQPRLYTLKVAPSACERKSTSTKLAEGFLRSVIRQMGSTFGAPRIIYGAGSAEGLARAFAATPRIVLCYDEFRHFEAKASITSSALLPMVNEMYEQNDYDNLTLSNPIIVRGGHLVLVSNATTENFRKLVRAEELQDIGFLNRLTLVTAKSPKRQANPQPPPEELLQPVRDKLIQYLRALPAMENGRPPREVLLRLTPDAKQTWSEWYMALDRVEETARLDNLGMRLMGLLAFTSGRSVIDKDLVLAVLGWGFAHSSTPKVVAQNEPCRGASAIGQNGNVTHVKRMLRKTTLPAPKQSFLTGR